MTVKPRKSRWFHDQVLHFCPLFTGCDVDKPCKIFFSQKECGVHSGCLLFLFSPGDRNSMKLACFHVRSISFKHVPNCRETRWLGGKGWGEGESANSAIQKKEPWQRNFLLVKMSYLCKYSYVPAIVLQLLFPLHWLWSLLHVPLACLWMLHICWTQGVLNLN